MPELTVPPLTTDLAGWLKANATHGDTVHLAEDTAYQVLPCIVDGLHAIEFRSHGSVLHSRNGLGMPHLMLRRCDGWWFPDRLCLAGEYVGPGPAPSARDDEHGLQLAGCRNTLVEELFVSNVAGDGLYLSRWGPDATWAVANTIVCKLTIDGTGRHGIASVAATDTLVVEASISRVPRTAANFEVHPGMAVQRWAAKRLTVAAIGLRILTATGEGEASGVQFDTITLPATASFNPTVYGTDAWAQDAIPDRDYGPRRDWRIGQVIGGKPQRLDADGVPVKRWGDDETPYYQAQFICVEGLALPDGLVADTRGSTLATPTGVS